MKLSKLLLLVLSIGLLKFTKAEDSSDSDDDFAFDEDTETGSKVCDKALEKMIEYHDEIDKDPLCSFNEEYAKKNNLKGVYTTEPENRLYYCTKCINKFNAAGLAMYKICGENAPEDYIYRVQLMYFVEQLLCLRASDTMKEKKVKDIIFCQNEIKRIKELEGGKPVEEWSEKHLCSECVAKIHYILINHEHFYNLIEKNKETTPFSDFIPLFNIEKECLKKWQPQNEKYRKEKKEDKKKNEKKENEKKEKKETKKKEENKEDKKDKKEDKKEENKKDEL